MKKKALAIFAIRKGMMFLFLLFITNCLSGGEYLEMNPQKSGTIHYKMEYQDLSLKFKIFKMFLPDESVLMFNPHFQRIQTSVSFIHLDFILDKELRIMYSIEDYKDKTLVLKEPLSVKEKERNVEILDEFIEINGIMCQKAVITEFPGENRIILFFTTAIEAHDPFLLQVGVEGCIVKKVSQLEDGGGTMIMTIDKINSICLEDEFFDLPKDAKFFTSVEDLEKAKKL